MKSHFPKIIQLLSSRAGDGCYRVGLIPWRCSRVAGAVTRPSKSILLSSFGSRTPEFYRPTWLPQKHCISQCPLQQPAHTCDYTLTNEVRAEMTCNCQIAPLKKMSCFPPLPSPFSLTGKERLHRGGGGRWLAQDAAGECCAGGHGRASCPTPGSRRVHRDCSRETVRRE